MTLSVATPKVDAAADFRGGVMLPSIDSTGLLTVTVITFWDEGAVTFNVNPKLFVADNVTNGGDPERVNGPLASPQSVFDIAQSGPVSIDTSDARFIKRIQTHTVSLNSVSGVDVGEVVDIFWGSAYREDTGMVFPPFNPSTSTAIGPQLVSGIPNHTSQEWFIRSQIMWNSGGNVDPILFNFNGVQLDVVPGANFQTNLGATSGQSGASLSYDLILDEKFDGGLPPNPAPPTSLPPGLSVDANGTLSSPALSTATWTTNTNPANTDADQAFGGFITATGPSGFLASVEYIGVFDVQGSNPPPIVNDGFVTILAGQNVNFTFTGIDPDGGSLVWSLLVPLNGPNLGASSSNFNTGNQQFSFFNTANVAPGVYVVTVQGQEPDGLTDAGNLFITVLPVQDGGVPEPATLAMLGLGGLALLRRRPRRTRA